MLYSRYFVHLRLMFPWDMHPAMSINLSYSLGNGEESCVGIELLCGFHSGYLSLEDPLCLCPLVQFNAYLLFRKAKMQCVGFVI